MYGSEGHMGLVPCFDLRYIWDWSRACLSGKYGTCPMGTYFSLQSLETFHDPIQECSPIQGYGKPMGPVPYLSPMLVWDLSHKVYGTSE